MAAPSAVRYRPKADMPWTTATLSRLYGKSSQSVIVSALSGCVQAGYFLIERIAAVLVLPREILDEHKR